MKKILLLIILCCPAVLAAQSKNGVTVSNLVASAGTVTFNVSWDKASMPLPAWRDTVWVFVDYNDAGTMKRLPLLPGATLTGTSAQGVGTVMEVPGNNNGVWVVGNARSAGSFSATVQLLTAIASTGGSQSRPLHGACAYASNYPPTGKYTSAANISFTGMAPYVLVLKHESGGTLTLESGNQFIVPASYTVQSFSDKTGAPGILKCVPEQLTGLSSDIAAICDGTATTLTLTAKGGSIGSDAIYEWGTGSMVGSNPLSPTTTAANSCQVNPASATTYWVRLRGAGECSDLVIDGKTVAIATHGAINAGTITMSSTTVTAGTASGITVQSAAPATGGGSLTYQWRRTGKSSATLTGSDATYNLNNDASNYVTAGMYYFNRYAKDTLCHTSWVAASGTYTLYVTGINQSQGGCTFTQPPVVGTFAAFPSTYSASTYVTLTDERDSKNYTVVKIGGRWIMAQNLNYQKDLTWQVNANQPSTVTGQDTTLIGHFWCPGGSTSTVTASTLSGCDVWGALYSWETAMMVDGKWTSDAQQSSSWSEPATYGTNRTSGNMQNHGRSGSGAVSDGRGICPENWHVPADEEWGDILNTMESAAGAPTHNTEVAYLGIDAGERGKAGCTCSHIDEKCATDSEAKWRYDEKRQGVDFYGFRVLPAGYRNYNGSYFNNRGIETYFWSSSAYSGPKAWSRTFTYNYANVLRYFTYRSFGFSVRCIRDL
jgi:uncharacterized protein (TIGR02145 family)